MANPNPPHVSAVAWSTLQANIGDKVALSASLTNIKDGTPIEFEISEYSGKPPEQHGGFEETEITSISKEAEGGQAEVKWEVTFSPETTRTRHLPEYRFRARKGSELGPVSKLLKLGDITEVTWVDPMTGDTRGGGANATQAYFKDTQKVKMRVTGFGLKGFTVNFIVSVKDPMARVSGWEPRGRMNNIKFVDGLAEADFQIEKQDLANFAFGTFRFEIELSYGGATIIPNKFQSGFARHYSSRLGIWGAGFTKPLFGLTFANARLIDIATAVGGVAMGRGSSFAMQRVANQVSPEETDFKVFGYSRGGVALAELCKKLQDRTIGVAFAYGIDPVAITGSKIVLPGNVTSAKCVYQRQSVRPFRGDPFKRPHGSENGIDNHEITDAERKIGHVDMPSFLFDDVVALIQ